MVIDGRKLSRKILKPIEKEILSNQLRLQLDILYIGKNEASEIFIKQKKKIGNSIGIKVNVHKIKDTTSIKKIESLCKELQENSDCTGYFIQLPVSQTLMRANIADLIAPEKDVDCLTSQCLGHVFKGYTDTTKPATVEAIIQILKSLKVDLKSKAITIINDSNLIGKPLCAYLLSKGATVSICNEFTKNIENLTRSAEILISATGVAHLIKKDMISNRPIIIDAGISYKEDTICGDVDFDNIVKSAKAITPVPGGVGPMTVACLFQNLLKLYKQQSTN